MGVGEKGGGEKGKGEKGLVTSIGAWEDPYAGSGLSRSGNYFWLVTVGYGTVGHGTYIVHTAMRMATQKITLGTTTTTTITTTTELEFNPYCQERGIRYQVSSIKE